MSVSITSSSNARTSGGTGSLTFSHTTDGNDLYVVVGCYHLDAFVTSVTFNGVNMYKVLRDFAAEGFNIWFLPSVGAVTANVVVTGGSYLTCGALNVSGAAGIRTTLVASGSSTTPSITLPTVSGDLVVDMTQNDAANEDWTVGAGQTLIYEQVDATSNEKSAMSYETASGSTTVMSWTLSISDAWAQFAFSFAPSSGGGGGSSAHSAVF